jgi:hypothetical protein
MTSDSVEQYIVRRRAAANTLREKSVIAFVAERLFRILQIISPGSYLSRTGTDCYVVAWFAVAMALGAISLCYFPQIPSLLRWFIFFTAAARVTDIIQVVVNLALFDRLGYLGNSAEKAQPVEDVTRSLVLLIWNFLELILWFGLVYVPLQFKHGETFWSRFYFSATTQLTIGYGDVMAVNVARAMAAVQGILGWGIAVVVIARVVASLPPVRGSNHNERLQSAAPGESMKQGS